MKKSGSNEKVKNNRASRKKGWKKTLKQWWQNYRWWVMLLGVIGVFILGYIGFSNIGRKLPLLEIFYRILQLFVLSFDTTITLNWALEVARWLAPAIAAYTAAKALAVIFREQFQLLKIGLWKGHIIICGLGNKGLLLSLKLKNYGYKVVAIELDEENDNIKECRDNGIIVLIGNATAPYYLNKAGLNRAKYLFSVCGQDDINAEIAVQARNLISDKKRKPLNCIVHIVAPQLCRLLKEREFELERNEGFRLEFINLFDHAAQSIMDDEQLSPFKNKEASQSPIRHLLIVGVGHMGESLVTHAAKKWMTLAGKTDEKLKITIIDKMAEHKKDLLYLRYHNLEKVCELIPLEIDIKSKDFENGHFLFTDNGECPLDIIYVCIDNNSFALSSALTLHQLLRNHNIPIVVRMSREAGLTKLLKDDIHRFSMINGFGFLDRVLNPELLHIGTKEILSRNIHDEYVRERLREGETLRINPFLVPWDKLPENMKESNRRQADYIGYKLHAIGCYIVPMYDWKAEPVEFTPEEIKLMAKIEHNLWMEERLKEDWKYAPGLKNPKKKTSPFLIPWGQLPEEEKEKDRNTIRKIPAYLSKAGFKIYRTEKNLPLPTDNQILIPSS
ncbi:MAG: NAD-binding protein [Candidatus Aminicenantes bacterium]|nr:MAG: NAD-binding protein [Candidatus Aminicenantes bacterium]